MSRDYQALPIRCSALRQEALEIFETVYREEKGWVRTKEQIFPEEDLHNSAVDWLAVSHKGTMVGVVRVLYEIPFELYDSYGFELSEGGFDVEKFVRENRIAEVGRFAVLPQYRRKIMAAATLMREAGRAAVARGFSHFITDVFEDDPNTPLGFHRRVLGFKQVATHDHGELRCDSRRITMLLDLQEALTRMQKKGGWLFRFLRNDIPSVARTAVAAG